MNDVQVYLDHAATAPLRPEARDAWLDAAAAVGNASSIHGAGQQARRVLEEARERLAAVIDADPIEVVFTSGGTEAVNLAVKGLWWARPADADAVVLPGGEHHATLDAVEWLEAQGARVRHVGIDATARISLAEFSAALPGAAVATALVANNEAGTINDAAALSAAAAAAGVPLRLHPEAEREIRGRFGGETSPQRLQMGEFPEGASAIPNPVNRIPGFSIREHHFVPGFPQMAQPMVEWVLDSRYAHLLNSEKWGEASILVYDAGESQLIPAMQSVETGFPGMKVFSLPSMGNDGSRIHVELGVRVDPKRVEEAMDALRRHVREAGFPFK